MENGSGTSNEVFIESILLAKNGSYVTFNVPPYEVWKYIPGVERPRHLKNQTKLFFPWVYSEWIVMASIRHAIMHDTNQWTYVENERVRKQLTYRYVFFSGLQQHHKPDAREHYRHSRVRTLLKKVTLPPKNQGADL